MASVNLARVPAGFVDCGDDNLYGPRGTDMTGAWLACITCIEDILEKLYSCNLHFVAI